jgi:predicted AlkP superfamily pyrophosphatase or phosphodiesterase
MPTVKRMIAGGASTLECQNVMPSNSWPNWSSLFSGAPPEIRTGENFPSIFSTLKAQAPNKTAVFFYEWSTLREICSTDMADMRDELRTNIASARMAADYIKERKPAFTAIVFDELDHVGHTQGWGFPSYYAKLTQIDGLIDIIEQGVKDGGIYDSTVFVLSADHGGILWLHGYDTPRMRNIPLIIYGAGIREGFTIPFPVSICDIAPTMAALLGLEVPPEWTGRAIVEIFK